VSAVHLRYPFISADGRLGAGTLGVPWRFLPSHAPVLSDDVAQWCFCDPNVQVQQKAHEQSQKDHTEIMNTFHTIGEINARETDTRITRIEKHLGLQPAK
jgi:hypothetical protein